MKHYLQTFCIAFLLMLVSGSAWILLVDPYALYPQEKEVLFPRKTAASDKGRNIKSYQVEKQSFESLIIGNSRVELGLPKSHSFYLGKVFNMGLPGAGVMMQYDFGWHAIKSTGSVRQVLVAVDFLDFLSVSPWDGSWNGNWQFRLKYRIGDKTDFVLQPIKRYGDLLGLIFSQDALIDAGLTAIQQSQDVNALDYQGFNDGRLYLKQVRNESFEALYQQKQQELRLRLANPKLILDVKSVSFIALTRFLSLLKQENIDVVLFVNPYQQPYLDEVIAAGLQEDLDLWKQEIQKIALAHNFDLYDFAISSVPVKEIVSLKSRNPEDSLFFWEPAHYKTTFGTLMLNAMQRKSCFQQIEDKLVKICNYFPSSGLNK